METGRRRSGRGALFQLDGTPEPRATSVFPSASPISVSTIPISLPLIEFCDSAATGSRKSAARQIRESVQADVFVGDPAIVYAAIGRRDPAGEFAGLGDPLHQASDKGAILLGR